MSAQEQDCVGKKVEGRWCRRTENEIEERSDESL